MSRLAAGGQVRRDRHISFRFDGRTYQGLEGDTLASALLANGVRLMGRSFKYHRPRGALSAGVEEPNALVQVGQGGRFEPNTRATDLYLYDGLIAQSQNRWPGLALDLGAVNGLISRFIPAGFYYKTFFGGPKAWLVFEHFIRMAAGLGKPPTAPEADAFEHRSAFCDLLVVGAGPAGLAAALQAARAGARVILVEQDRQVGGTLVRDPATIDGQEGLAWAEAAKAEILAAGGRILLRTTAIGYWDHDLVTLVERRVEAGQPPGPDGLSQRLWHVRARRTILATGALERSLLFSGNDLPQVMLSTAVRTWIHRFGVLPGCRAVVLAGDDDAYRTATLLQQAGAQVTLLELRQTATVAGQPFPVLTDVKVLKATGGSGGVRSVEITVKGQRQTLDCDLVAMAGGFSPVVHLHMQAGGALDWSESDGSFRPVSPRQNQFCCGAANGTAGLIETLAEARSEAAALLTSLGFNPADSAPPSVQSEGTSGPGLPSLPLAAHGPAKTTFVDFQNDVTLSDIDLAWREGYRSVEHLKRYTTLGMATDQGKTSNILGLTQLAALEQRPVPAVGTTTFRPPYTPVTIGALAGAAASGHSAPRRRMPLHDQHLALDPLWQPLGYWDRPRAYPRPGETLHSAALREARATRTTVGLTDVSTLAKFDIQGPDAGVFLERVCATRVRQLAVGRGRYTFMLREDGLVMDDGTVWRLAEDRWLLTSSSGGADRMAAHLSYVRKVLAPDLKVAIANVQEHWAAVACAGPLAASLVAPLLLDGAAPAHMGLGRGVLGGTPLLVLAASYSGERAFEIYVAADQAAGLWRHLADKVQAADGALYGLEALEILRIEKGHVVVGGEIDGRTTPGDLGMGKMLRPGGGYFGAQALQRPALQAPGRAQLVGLEAMGGIIPEGSMLLPSPGAAPEGHVTAAGLRVLQGGSIALGLLRDGEARLGETLLACSPTRGVTTRVKVVPTVFHDPAGERYRG